MDTNVKAFFGLLIFILIMGSMALIYKKFTGGTSLLKRSGKYMKTVDRMMVSNDKWIELVEVGGKVILIGITGTSITKLDTFEMEELNELEPLEQPNFRDILGRYKSRKKV
jgi:flagellar protein FliO/FliZ